MQEFPCYVCLVTETVLFKYKANKPFIARGMDFAGPYVELGVSLRPPASSHNFNCLIITVREIQPCDKRTDSGVLVIGFRFTL